MSCFEKFREILPRKGTFSITLTDVDISGKNYKHVLNIWKHYGRFLTL